VRPVIRAGALLAIVLLVAQPSQAATAREMYAAATARAKALHDETGREPATAPTIKEFRSAVAAFEAVVRRHPTTGYADNALLEAAVLAREAHDRFGEQRDQATALRLLTWLVKEYPTSPLLTKARDELKRANAEASASASDVPAKPVIPAVSPSAATPARSEGRPQAAPVNAPAGPVVLRDIRRTVLGDTVRVTIELDSEVAYHSERIENPARVLFDLSSTRPGPAVMEGTSSFSGDVVRHIRVGRHPNHVLRVVLDLEGVKRYSVFTLYAPYRIVVDCERGPALPAVPSERIAEEKLRLPAPDPEPPRAPRTEPRPGQEPETRPKTESPAKAASSLKPLSGRPLRVTTRTLAPLVQPQAALALVIAEPHAPLVPLRPTRVFAPTRRMLAWQPVIHPPLGIPRPEPTSVTVSAPARPASNPAAVEKPVVPASAQEATATMEKFGATSEKPAATADRPMTPSAPLTPPPNGFSMARQLGLGASRIVIDPGHGGHDPGAEGSGLFEATVVLDVALRLEKLLTASGIEAVLTRRTDEYIPLEERTAIANRAQGDLFLSIHANASRNRAARGIESYFLNFATTPDAEAVAARENASTGLTMSSLTEIVKAIALNNKLDESKNFAALVQRQMVEHLQGSNKGLRNHGVKQAPFVVLIGASMPSVLVEISFITHSQEGRLLKTGAYRQKVAEALFDAIRGYQKSLKGAAVLTRQ
jgi:N-acetylmuramoyl-L-alanine amidase